MDRRGFERWLDLLMAVSTARRSKMDVGVYREVHPLVLAVQWDGTLEHAHEIGEWIRSTSAGEVLDISTHDETVGPPRVRFQFEKPEPGYPRYTVDPLDYVCRHPDGWHYALAPGHFEANFTRADGVDTPV